MSVIHAPQDRPVTLRMLVVPAVLVLGLVTYGLKLWYLQVVVAEDMRERAEVSSKISVSRIAPRGQITDRNGSVLASVAPTAVVMAKPKSALADPAQLQAVASLLDVSVGDLKKAINKVRGFGDLPAPVFVGAEIAVASEIADRAAEFPAFSVETQAMRRYHHGAVLGHIMGYVRTPRDVDVARLKAQGIKPAEYVGIQGLERQYEQELMGQAGSEEVAVDARRRPIRPLGSDAQVPGSSLVLSLDVGLQTYANQLLKGRRGSIVMLDPRSGEVLCLVSSPGFDGSLFLKGLTKDEYASLAEDPSRPLFFRAASGAYPPGSTFKIVVTLASWMAGNFSTARTYHCPGYIQTGRKRTKCLGNHGTIAYDTAFTKSCNTYFGSLARDTGREALLKACEALGLGHDTGLDLPTESAGVVPTPEWWAKHRDRRFSGGDVVNFGIGQGELSTTPLQMACVVALVANRGVSYRPHLVKAVIGPEDGAKPVPVKPSVLGRVEAPSEVWSALTRGMVHVIQSGTAKSAHIDGLVWGGKTGSAEHQRNSETHSWFVGVAPIDKPTVVISTIVEDSGHGGEVAAPVSRDCIRYWLNKSRAPRGQSGPIVNVEDSRSRSSTDGTEGELP